MDYFVMIFIFVVAFIGWIANEINGGYAAAGEEKIQPIKKEPRKK